MQGYNFPKETKLVPERHWVGCNNCKNTWYFETMGIGVIKKSCSYMYDACDKCYDKENNKFIIKSTPTGFDKLTDFYNERPLT